MLINAVDLSFLMVTNRDWNTFGKIVADSLFALRVPFSFEVLVYSPFPVKDSRVQWFEDTTEDGCVSGFNHLVKFARGRYFTPAVDDLAYDEKVFKAVPFLDSAVFANRKYKVCAVCTGGSTMIPSPSRPTEFGPVPHCVENNFRIVGFPVMSRETVDMFGDVMFPPQFKHHYGDNWLAYYLGRLGEQVLECDGTPFIGLPHGLSRLDYDAYDFKIYCELIRKFEVEGYREYH
jgi:hypothetical protein